MRSILALLVLIVSLGPASSDEWRRYVDQTFGYSVTVPDDGFDIETDPSRNGLIEGERLSG